MPTRETILGKLDKEETKLLERYRSLSTDDLERACTESEVDGATPWSAKDHLAHLAMIERAFLGMIRRTLDGSDNPLGIDFRSGNRDDAIAKVHQGNQNNVEEHKDESLENLIADLKAARAETLALLESLEDSQLDLKVPGAPWADGTIGGVLITNAYHQVQHWAWIEEGLAKAAAGS